MATNGKPLGSDLAAQIVISADATTHSFPDAQQRIVEVSPEMTVDMGLQVLAKAGVCSAPVWDAENTKYLGFLDVLDLIAMAVDSVDLMTMLHTPMDIHQLARDAAAQRQQEEDAADTALKRQKTAVSHKTVAEMFANGEALIGMQQWHPVYEGTSFRKVLELLAHKCRRVAVLSLQTSRVVKIISQSAVVAMLYEHMRTQGELVKETPGSTGFGIKPVLSVRQNTPARDAFRIMVEHCVSAVAVLDDKGALLTTVSTRDIRMLVLPEFAHHAMLDLAVRDYVQRVRTRDPSLEARPAVIAVGLATSLTMVIGKLAATKSHRVFVEDAAGKCVGVISVNDVILLLERGNHFGAAIAT